MWRRFILFYFILTETSVDTSGEVRMLRHAYTCEDVVTPVDVKKSAERSGDGDEKGRGSDSYEVK